MEVEVAAEVRGMKGVRAGFPLVMRVEELKGWLREATFKKERVKRMWNLLVRLLQRTFRDMTPPEDLEWATMFLIPKG